MATSTLQYGVGWEQAGMGGVRRMASGEGVESLFFLVIFPASGAFLAALHQSIN